jgi:hypothetical protein
LDEEVFIRVLMGVLGCVVLRESTVGGRRDIEGRKKRRAEKSEFYVKEG